MLRFSRAGFTLLAAIGVAVCGLISFLLFLKAPLNALIDPSVLIYWLLPGLSASAAVVLWLLFDGKPTLAKAWGVTIGAFLIHGGFISYLANNDHNSAGMQWLALGPVFSGVPCAIIAYGIGSLASRRFLSAPGDKRT